MKSSLKPIAILVIISLLGIFTYQAYWLIGLYHTMKSDMENGIRDAMRMSDYNEMMLRVEKLRKENKEHGEVSVSAGYNDTGKSFVRSSTTVSKINTKGPQSAQKGLSKTNGHVNTTYLNDSTKVETIVQHDTLSKSKDEGILRSKQGLDIIIANQKNMTELAGYFQRGLHAGLDIIIGPDFNVYDSLLNVSLKEKGINIPHRLEYFHSGSNLDSSYTFRDTIGVSSTKGYMPGPKSIRYDYNFDFNSHYTYRLWLDPVNTVVIKQMSGILVTSFIIFVILGFSFWFLIHTILRQKTLEEMKSDFTNNITHELKTPIAVAYAANDALLNFKQAENPEQRNKYLRICQEQLQQLSGLVEQILSMSMEQRKTFRLHPETLQLRELLQSLVEQHKIKAEKPLDITLDIEPSDLSIQADRTHFMNILSNLIDNGIKYSLEKAQIKITCRKSVSGEVQISISDHGIGIQADKLPHIFDKFYRVPSGNRHNTKGYGLGLFYVKTMTEKHGNTISVESTPEKGSVFTLHWK